MSRMPLKDALRVFGYSSFADVTAENLKKLYRQAAMRRHPDLNGGDGSRMAEANLAKETLDLFLKDRDIKPPFDAWADFNAKQAKKEEQKAEKPKAGGPKAERCGHPTKSGPCWRPKGHPTNHASEQNLKTKAANAKARKQAAA